jgi:uncharacterized membrane protein
MGDGTVVVALVAALSAILVAAVTGWYTFRAARRNTESTREIEDEKLSVEQVAQWRQDVVTLRQQRSEDAAEHRGAVEAMNVRLDRLADRLEAVERRERILILWAREVVRIMRQHSVVFPAPPPGVVDD